MTDTELIGGMEPLPQNEATRRASPAAAVPEGALPPEPWGDDFEAWLEVRTGHEVRTEIRAYARAAVEADRAHNPVLQEQAATMLAQRKKIQRLEAALADRAQQGEPVGAGMRECPDCEGSAKISANEWCERCDRSGILPDIATKAAAPADAAVEPDWSDSKTLISEMWKNPLIPMGERLQIADGAVRFRNDVIARLRAKLAERAAPVPDTGIPTAGEDEEA